MVENKVEMSLEDIIKKTKSTLKRGSGAKGAAGRGGKVQKKTGGQGQAKRGAKAPQGQRGGAQKKFNQRPRQNQNQGNDFFYGRQQQQQVVRQVNIKTGPVKVSLANLDYRVSDNDVRELFQEFGKMKSAAVHYGANGKSLGTAHVLFDRRADAVRAVKQYNGVHLDGRAMKLSMEGGFGMQQQTFNSPARNQNIRGARGGIRGRGAGGMRGGRGGNVKRLQKGAQPVKKEDGQKKNTAGRGGRGKRGRGGKAKTTPPTVEDLDKELDAYVTEASK